MKKQSDSQPSQDHSRFVRVLAIAWLGPTFLGLAIIAVLPSQHYKLALAVFACTVAWFLSVILVTYLMAKREAKKEQNQK